MEQRTTRPTQWTRTSLGVPRIAPGIRSEKRISRPAGTWLSIRKRAPLAETFRVTAANSPFPVDSTTGKERGKRTAQRTSCLGDARIEGGAEIDRFDFEVCMCCTMDLSWPKDHSSRDYASSL